MRFKNLTPHHITIQALDGQHSTVPPYGPIARLRVERRTLQPLQFEGMSFGRTHPVLTTPVNLPSQEDAPGTIYIVSTLVADHVKRPDVVSPGELVRDLNGTPIYCKGLCSYAD